MPAKKFLPLGLLLFLGSVLAPAYAQDDAVVAPFPPPPMVVEAVPDPILGLSWEAGHWEWAEASYVWRPGYWLDANLGFKRSLAVWQRSEAGWEFVAPQWVPDGV